MKPLIYTWIFIIKVELVYKLPTVDEIKDFSKENLIVLWPEYLRSLNPEQYPVDLSQKCWDNKMRNITEARVNVENMTK